MSPFNVRNGARFPSTLPAATGGPGGATGTPAAIAVRCARDLGRCMRGRTVGVGIDQRRGRESRGAQASDPVALQSGGIRVTHGLYVGMRTRPIINVSIGESGVHRRSCLPHT